MPNSPDRLPLVPPALRRLNTDTAWDIQEVSPALVVGTPDTYEREGPHVATSALNLPMVRKMSNWMQQEMITTNRAAKSTIQGVVNQFSQLHHRKPTFGRILSSLSNLVRRICNHEARTMRLLDNCQTTDLDVDSDGSQEETAQAFNTMYPNRETLRFPKESEIGRSSRDREDSPVYMMLTFKDIDPSQNSRKLRGIGRHDTNPRRRRWTSTACKYRTGVHYEGDYLSCAIHPSQHGHDRPSKSMRSVRLKDGTSKHSSHQYSTVTKVNTKYSHLPMSSGCLKSNRMSSRLSNFLRRPRRLSPSDTRISTRSRLDTVVSALCTGDSDGNVSPGKELQQMTNKYHHNESSSSSLDMEAETDWTPPYLRRHTSSYDLIDLYDQSLQAYFEAERGSNWRSQTPTRMFHPAISKSTAGNTSPLPSIMMPHSLSPSPSKSDSLLPCESYRNVDHFTSLSLVTCGHLAASTDDLVSALDMLVVKSEA